MARGATAGSEFFTGVLSKLSPEDRQKGEQALEALKTLGGGTVIAAVGDGVLAQSEFSRQADQLKAQQEELAAQKAEIDQREQGLSTWHGELTTWHQANKDALARARNGQLTATPAAATAVIPPGVLTDEAYNERITAERASFLGFQRDQNAITREHFGKFGEIVELEPLLRHPQIANIGLVGVYELVHKERLAKHQTDAERRGRARRVVELTPTGAGSGSPLDALTGGVKEPLVDAAASHYARLQAERTASGRG